MNKKKIADSLDEGPLAFFIQGLVVSPLFALIYVPVCFAVSDHYQPGHVYSICRSSVQRTRGDTGLTSFVAIQKSAR